MGYFFTRNLHGDIIGVYRSTDSKLIGTYEYDLWGKLISVKEASKGIDTNGILTKNPFRYRGYYYDNETGFYNLNFRYYDPAIRRFISADSTALLMTATTSINCKNLFNYCENNPVNGKDSSGAVIETPFDLVTLGISIVDVCMNPTDPWAWLGLAGDAVDLIPCVTGVGEAVKGAKYAVRYGDDVWDVAVVWFKSLGKADNAGDATTAIAKATKRGGTDLDIPTTKPSINQGKEPFRNADFKKPDIKMVNDAANQFGIDRKEFGNYIHEIKADLGMKANQNFTYQELLELAIEVDFGAKMMPTKIVNKGDMVALGRKAPQNKWMYKIAYGNEKEYLDSLEKMVNQLYNNAEYVNELVRTREDVAITIYVRSEFAEISYAIPSHILKKLSLLDCSLNFSILSFGMVIDT